MRKGGKLVWVVVFILLLTPLTMANESHPVEAKDKKEVNDSLIPLPNDQIDQSQEMGGGGAILCGWWKWAQSFKPSLDVLTRVFVLVRKHGNVNYIRVSIRDSLHGKDLTSVSKSPDEIPTEASEWIEFDFDDIPVTPGKTYYIVYSTSGGDNKENYYVLEHSTGDVYDKGDGWIGWSYGTRWEIWNPKFDFCFETYGRMNQMPGKPSKPQGSSFGMIGKEYIYKTSAVDPDGDRIRYGWDWDGDDVVDEWTDYYDSGVEVSINHTWNQTGTYEIKVKAQDEFGGESDWSDPITVIMPLNVNQAILQKIMEWLLEVLRNFLFSPF